MKRKRRLLIPLSLAAAGCTLFGMTACKKQELSFQETRTEDGETAYAVNGIGSVHDANIVIPSTFNGCPVVRITESAFISNSRLQSVVIPDSVTVIEDWAFAHCGSLENVVIGDGVTSIGNSVFSGCNGLTSIVIPDSVTEIGGWAFSNCGNLTSVLISDGITSIGNNTFAGCTGLTGVVIPDGVSEIGDYAFYYCSGLESVVIPESVIGIGRDAFAFCDSLTEIAYQGTKEQWEKMAKGSDWAYGLGECTVRCTDGTLTIGVRDKDEGVNA